MLLYSNLTECFALVVKPVLVIMQNAPLNALHYLKALDEVNKNSQPMTLCFCTTILCIIPMEMTETSSLRAHVYITSILVHRWQLTITEESVLSLVHSEDKISLWICGCSSKSSIWVGPNYFTVIAHIGSLKVI